MQFTYQDSTADLKIRKAIGREHLYANRVEDALAVFAGILRDHPDDVESLVILGDLYLASGDSSTAVQLYSRAMQHKQEDAQIEQRLHLAQVEKQNTPQKSPESIPVHPEAVARLLQRLTGRFNPISEEEIESASGMLDEILRSPNPSLEVAKHLDKIDHLLPALLELNIRQARSDGRFDLSEALQNLQSNILMQIGPPPTALSPALPARVEDNYSDQPETDFHFEGEVLLLSPIPNQPDARTSLLAEGLSMLGAEVIFSSELPSLNQHQPKVVITGNPHAHPQVMAALAASAAAQLPIIVDIDKDFEHMPVEHPLYNNYGLGNTTASRSYMSALLLANLVTVPSKTLDNLLTQNGYQTMLVPNGWSRNNPHWKDKAPRRSVLNIGWIGQPGQFEDLSQIRRVIVRVLREFPDTQIVIVGDQQVYHLFESLPSTRRKFLPLPNHKDFPHILDQIDILLAPYRNNEYNNSISDELLVQASIKGIPWVASPISAFEEWQAGGLIVSTLEEWHTQLRKIIMEPKLRNKLKNESQKQALAREISNLKNLWLNAILQAQNNFTALNNPKTELQKSPQ